MQIKAFAKLNLTLDITGKREDGYHLLDSVMLSVQPADIITISKADEISVGCSAGEIEQTDNIAYKAAKTFFETVGINGGAKIYIEKHIPLAAGLGGGSADAAAVICGLDRLYNTNLSLDALCEIGLTTGADVPFCIVGGVARVKGIGEIIKPLPFIDGLYFVIVKNGTKASTKAAYEKIDALSSNPKTFTENTVQKLICEDYEEMLTFIGNAFEKAVGLYSADTLLKPFSPKAVCLSGSGPSVFGAFTDEASANNCYKELKAQGTECYLSRVQPKGIVIE